MFSTFVGIEAGDEGGDHHRRQVVGNACVECRRRKTKCSGAHPCSGCLACQRPCVFPELGRRRVGGRKKGSYTKGSGYADIYKRLFGNIPVESLRHQSRSELLEVICSQADSSPSEQGVSDSISEVPQGDVADTSDSSPSLEAVRRLRQLQLEESMIREWDDTLAEYRPRVEDEASVLALSPDRASSYVGISSVMIAVRALAKVIPSHFCDQSGPVLSRLEEKQSAYTRFPGQTCISTVHTDQTASYYERQRLIDAYFGTIHVFAPIIHERTFRNDYLTNTRDDAPWLALLNIVFALGSLALASGGSDQDIQYYKQAHGYLTLESLGWGSLETLQALVLMGGLYLHYRNRPNLGSALMGASYRLACALGLHYDTSRGSPELPGLPLEVKRRIWWTIHVLDTWGTATSGRPLAPIDGCTEPPRNILDDEHGEVASTRPTIHSPLIHNIGLCQIIARIQDRLLASPILACTELVSYDNMLTAWFNGLPTFLRSNEVSTPGLHDARVVLKWRFQNTRILLYRPYILDAVVRNSGVREISVEEQAAVNHCRGLAADAISTIQCEWQPNKISCWHGVWFLFQACLIPIMALAVEPPECESYPSWLSQVETSIALCKQMAGFAPAGHKILSFLERLLVAVTQPLSEMGVPALTGDLQLSLHSMKELFPGEWDHIVGGEAKAFPIHAREQHRDSAGDKIEAGRRMTTKDPRLLWGERRLILSAEQTNYAKGIVRFPQGGLDPEVDVTQESDMPCDCRACSAGLRDAQDKPALEAAEEAFLSNYA
ncbi:hypothetical protein BJX65DRAFT_312556 [Aspergillus insuetus]